MNENIKFLKQNNSGVTLLILAFTIIVLTIIAGVAINVGTGNKGIIRKAKNAVSVYNETVQNEVSEEYLEEIDDVFGVDLTEGTQSYE